MWCLGFFWNCLFLNNDTNKPASETVQNAVKLTSVWCDVVQETLVELIRVLCFTIYMQTYRAFRCLFNIFFLYKDTGQTNIGWWLLIILAIWAISLLFNSSWKLLSISVCYRLLLANNKARLTEEKRLRQVGPILIPLTPDTLQVSAIQANSKRLTCSATKVALLLRVC